MKILVVTPVYPPPPGGIQTLTKNLEHGLTSLGHDVKIVNVPRDESKLFRDYIPQLRPDHPRDLPELPYFNRVFRESKIAIQELDPDIVHATLVGCWPALEAAKQKGIPTVLSTHALELSTRRYLRSARARVDRIHVVSQFTRDLTLDVMDIPEDQTRIIHPSITVPDEIADPTPNGPVFTLARLVERKNVENLIKGWKLLPQSLQEKHGLFIGGDGEQRTDLESMADDDPTITMMGRISEERKDQMLSEASVFALTPLRDGFDVEGFGIVYIEAQSHGTPVIGSSTGGVPEAVGDAGLLVDHPTDPEATADTLQTMLVDESIRDDCYQNMRRRISDFNKMSIAKEHVDSYREVIRESGSNK